MSEQPREVNPFSKDLHPSDRRFDPVILPSEAEDPAPKGLSVQELANYSDMIPEIPADDSEQSEKTVILESEMAGVVKATTPPKVVRPGPPPSL